MSKFPCDMTKVEQMLGSGAKCGLSGQIMRNPVVITSTNDPDPRIIVGHSYERLVLAKYVYRRVLRYGLTRYVPNDSLRRLIAFLSE